MKKVILLSLSLWLFSACTATSGESLAMSQQDREMSSLKNALNIYSDATMHGDVDTLLKFVYPKVFTLIPKKRIKSKLMKMYVRNKALKITDVEYQKISPIRSYSAGRYAVVNSKMTTELISPVLDNDKFEQLLFDKLKSQMGEDAQVIHDKSKHVFIIKKESQIIGIKESDDGWKFVGYEQAKKYESKKVIPESIMRNLN